MAHCQPPTPHGHLPGLAECAERLNNKCRFEIHHRYITHTSQIHHRYISQAIIDRPASCEEMRSLTANSCFRIHIRDGKTMIAKRLFSMHLMLHLRSLTAELHLRSLTADFFFLSTLGRHNESQAECRTLSAFYPKAEPISTLLLKLPFSADY